jgi:rare lipoprotein A
LAPSIVGSCVGSGGAVVLSIGRERYSCVGSGAVGGGSGVGSRRVGGGLRWFAIAATAAMLAACAQPGMVTDQSASSAGHRQATAGKKTSAQVASRRAPETKDSSYGLASFYSYDPQTASGEKFDKNELTAAHRTLPFGTKVRVTNVATGQSVTVRVNDRGPFVNGRVVDVSHGAADKLGITGQGVAKVKLEVVE